MMRRALGLLLTLGWCACEAPPVFPGKDQRQQTATGRIEGQVVVNSTARGRVVLFLYDAAHPPPPVGTGRPLTFTVLSRDAVFAQAADGDAGPFTAPFAFSLVKPGSYLIRGFVDANEDFIPWYGVTADTDLGDVGGAAVDPTTRASRLVEVATDDAGHLVPALDVPVSFADSARLPVDRPVFSVAGGDASVTVAGTPQVLTLRATPIVEGVMQQAAPVFLLRFVDDDGDGVPDDANGDGRPDLWPRVVVRKLAEGQTLLDENDLDKNGLVDDTGADYEHADGTTDGLPDVVVLAAGFDPTEYAPALFDAMGRVKQTPTPVPTLKLVLQPRAFDVRDPLRPQPLKAVPIGRYAITVIQQTGQTWRVPNELAPGVADALSLPVIATQSFFVQTQ